MKHILFPLVMAIALWLPAKGTEILPTEQTPSADASWRNDFTNPKTLSDEWKFDGSRFLVPRTKFFLASEPSAFSGKIMVVEADKGTGVMLTAPHTKVDLSKTPVMRWRWRVVRPILLKPGETEPDDQAIVLYFGDGTLLKQRCVGYRWEVNTPVGSSGLHKYAAGMMTVNHITMRNHTTPAGEWVMEERNVAKDYREAYGEAPSKEFIVSVGGNSQYSGSNSRAEIDFIEFIPARPEEKAEPKPKQAPKQ